MCKVTEQTLSPSPSPCGGPKRIRVLNRRKRRVSFGENVEHVFEKDYTQEDRDNIWYNGEEFQAIKNEIYSMMRFANMRQSKALNSGSKVALEIDKVLEECHWRGLEHIREKRPRKEMRRRHARDTLHFQKYTHCLDPVQLGIYVAANTKGSTRGARELAIADEQEALEIHNEGLAEANSDPADGPEPAQHQQQAAVARKIDPVTSMSICRGEGCRIAGSVPPPLRPEEDALTLSLLILTPYKMVAILLPCLC